MSYAQLAAALDDGVEAGVLIDPESRRGIELATARTWLFLLGYLRDDNGRRVLDDSMRSAVTAFCRESGMRPPANGFDESVLATLARLLTFDELQPPKSGKGRTVTDRFAGFDPSGMVLRRAVQVRLYALDLVDRLPGKTPNPAQIEEGLERFIRVRRLLRLDPVSGQLDRQTVDALFDHDQAVQRLREEKHSLTLAHPAGSSGPSRSRNRKLVKKFVNAIGRIELWLIGYLVRPRDGMAVRDATNRNLPMAMKAFWRDQPEDVRPARERRGDLNGLFFDRVQAVMQADESDDEKMDRALYRSVLDDAELARKVRDETRRLGARIIDGVRRVARFMFGWIRKKLGGLVALARNLASVLCDKVRLVFDSVREVVLSIGDSWRYLVRKPSPGSDPRHLIMLHDGDFDFSLLVNARADPGRVRSISAGVASMARVFAATTRLIDLLVSAFLDVIRKAGIGGWFGVLLALLSIRQRLGEIVELVRLIRQLRPALLRDELALAIEST
jgi:hypothetical protein